MGHFMGDPESYRPEEDTEAAKQRDSIERLAAELREAGVEYEELEELRENAHERVDSAIEWAKEQPQPDPEDAYGDVFVNPESGVTTTEPTHDLAGQPRAGGED